MQVRDDEFTKKQAVTSETRHFCYGDWEFEQRIEAQLGASGLALSARCAAAHEALVSALGEGGFEALDAYISASTARSCAREAAIVELVCGPSSDER